jgi:hypothetical protein
MFAALLAGFACSLRVVRKVARTAAPGLARLLFVRHTPLHLSPSDTIAAESDTRERLMPMEKMHRVS